MRPISRKEISFSQLSTHESTRTHFMLGHKVSQPHGAQFEVFAQHPWQPVIESPTAHMAHMMRTDIGV